MLEPLDSEKNFVNHIRAASKVKVNWSIETLRRTLPGMKGDKVIDRRAEIIGP